MDGGLSKAAITHKDNKIKTYVKAAWTPPDNFKGEVNFKATVAKDFSTYWTDINEDVPIEGGVGAVKSCIFISLFTFLISRIL